VLWKDRGQLPWFLAFLVGTAAAVAAFVWFGRGQATWPKGSSALGLIFGFIALALFIFECLLWPRKRVRWVRILGSGVSWMRAHIWLGLLCLPLVLLHSGFHWGGWLTTALAANFALVIGSGIVGWVFQNRLPAKMTEEVGEETIYSQISSVMRSHAIDMARLIDDVCGLPPQRDDGRDLPRKNDDPHVLASKDDNPRDRTPKKMAMLAVEYLEYHESPEDAPVYRSESIQRPGRVRGTVVYTRQAVERVRGAEELRSFFGETAVHYLLRGAASKSPLRSAAVAETRFHELRDRLPAAALPVVEQLERQCSRRRQLDRQSRLHFWLHSWLWVHLPLSTSLLILTVVHALAAWRY
jgi:hypothetical protein